MNPNEFPEWMPDNWDDFMEMRINSKHVKVNTDESKRRLIKKLTGWRNDGFNIELIIDNSIEKQWRGLFLPKGMEPRQTHSKPHESLAPIVNGIVGQHKVPADRTYQEQHDRANKVRSQAIEAMKKLGI